MGDKQTEQGKPGDESGAAGSGAGSEKTEVSSPTSTSPVLVGTENYKDNETEIALALRMKSSGVESTLMIPDIAKVAKGGPGGEVFITRRISLQGSKLKSYLIKKNVLSLKDKSKTPEAIKKMTPEDLAKEEVNEPVGKFLSIAEISLEAFYFNKTGPWLMQFNLKTETEVEGEKTGLIGALTEDPALGELFDVLGASVRVFKCGTADQYRTLQKYAAMLAAE